MNETRKRVLLTGASGGIGSAIAERLASAGYEVVSCYNSHAPEFGTPLRLNLLDREECAQKILADIEANGTYYAVVLAAGIARDGAFPALTGEDWDAVINTNLNGFFNALHPCIMPLCRAKKPGRIVALSSVSGIIGNRGQVNYSASKAGIIGAVKALAVELASRQITVNCVAPGLVETEMLKNAPLDKILPLIPLQRIGKPSEVAATVEFLLSEGAAYITRQVISVNGGLA